MASKSFIYVTTEDHHRLIVPVSQILYIEEASLYDDSLCNSYITLVSHFSFDGEFAPVTLGVLETLDHIKDELVEANISGMI